MIAGFRRMQIAAVTAAMPVAVARAASAPSQLDHAALEHRHVGIGEARIEIPVLVALETRFALLGTVVDEALGEKHGLGGFAELGTDGAGMDQSGLGAVMGG